MCEPAECSEVLQHAGNLTDCYLVLLSDPGAVPAPDIRLASLKSLVLTQLEAVDEPSFGYLETLTAPALRTHEVSEALLQPDPVSMLGSFISTSGCRLQELLMHHRGYSLGFRGRVSRRI